MMDTLPGYDAWLEAPYHEAEKAAAAEEQIIEALIVELELDDDEIDGFDFGPYIQEWMEAEDEARYEEYLEREAEIAADAHLDDYGDDWDADDWAD
jgi:hypothetical protein